MGDKARVIVRRRIDVIDQHGSVVGFEIDEDGDLVIWIDNSDDTLVPKECLPEIVEFLRMNSFKVDEAQQP